MTKEEIVTALLDDMEMPYLQDWQARDIVDFVLKKYTEGLPAIKGWVARDEDGTLCCFSKKPDRMSNTIAGHFWFNANAFELRKDVFPKLTWEDEPIEVELIIESL